MAATGPITKLLREEVLVVKWVTVGLEPGSRPRKESKDLLAVRGGYGRAGGALSERAQRTARETLHLRCGTVLSCYVAAESPSPR
ncbi:hypothetical protein KFL_005980040 [Klebsormidium nitens]|uniref:Uncharacterized protein n=1 Tax=Klebsormidium nitens TaxID=105231 RepID=A0A1Y1IKY4_KLENI|nr:hypothetical protein KFL_005980040 [Klebsormidium nitens]|eukprot:GAQ90089.1 hypothetical protein KFL_005980040 [Klebsormidium nitens]